MCSSDLMVCSAVYGVDAEMSGEVGRESGLVCKGVEVSVCLDSVADDDCRVVRSGDSVREGVEVRSRMRTVSEVEMG